MAARCRPASTRVACTPWWLGARPSCAARSSAATGSIRGCSSSTRRRCRTDVAGAADSDPAYPWVAGFAAALETFPALLGNDESVLLEPLALLYRHLDPEDLDDADTLLAEIEALEPPADLAAAVEELVRATLLLADVADIAAPR